MRLEAPILHAYTRYGGIIETTLRIQPDKMERDICSGKATASVLAGVAVLCVASVGKD